MITVLRNPTYRRLFSAQVVALIGTGLLTVALGLLAFELAGAAAGSVLGTALTIKMVAYVGVAPFIAALIDRMPRKIVLVGADLIRLVIALLLPFVTEIWQIYVLVLVLQSASATFTPAFQSLIPSVLPEPAAYTRALALSRLAYDLEALLSPLLAAVLLTAIGFSQLFVGTAIGFAASAVLVIITTLPAMSTDRAASTFAERLSTGIQVFFRTSSLRFLMFANITVAAGTSIVLVNSVVYAKSVFGFDDAALAIALGAYGVGSLIVALNIPGLVDRFGTVATMTLGSGVVITGLLAAAAITAIATTAGIGWGWLLAVWAVLGSGTSLINTPSARLLAEASTPTNRNLVYTAQFALSHACFLLTYPLTGWLGAFDLTATALVLVVVAVVGTAGVLVLRRRAAAPVNAAVPSARR